MLRIYEYLCVDCEEVCERLVQSNNRKEPQICDNCGGLSNYVVSAGHLDYLHMGVDAVGNPTAGDKWARMHEEEGKINEGNK